MNNSFLLFSRRIATLFLVALSTHVAIAYDFKSEGIAYNINEDQASVSVTRLADGEWYEGDVVIPQKVSFGGKYYYVTEIGDNAFDRKLIFRNKTENLLSSIYIPETIRRIGNDAFAYQYQLNAATIPNSVTEIGYHAFYQCESLLKAKFSTALTAMGVGAFQGCALLTKADLSATSLKSVSRSSFFQCKNLAKVKLPADLQVIGDSAFYNCSKLKNIDLPETLQSIGVAAFAVTRLESVKLPNSLTEIKDATFVSTPLVHVGFPKNLTTIGDGAFACTNLDAVLIPPTVTEIGDRAFWYSDNLKSVFIPNSVNTIGEGAFFHCFNLSNITFGNSISSLGKDVLALDNFIGIGIWGDEDRFQYNGALNLTITNDYVASAKLWEDGHYGYPNIQKLILSNNITKVNGETLISNRDYDIVKNIFCLADVPPVVTPPATKTRTPKLHVPENAIAKYFTADHWKQYVNINGDAVAPQSINFDEHNLTINVGTKVELEPPTLLYEDGSSVSIKPPTAAMFSTNVLVATVTYESSYGTYTGIVVEAKGKGECDIVTFYGNVIDYCHVVVNGDDPPVDDDEDITVVLECNETSLFPNEIVTLHPSVNVKNLPNPTFSVECDNQDVLLVRSLMVNNSMTIQGLALKPGVANITVKCDNYADAVEPAVCKVFITRELSDINIDGHVNVGDVSAIYDVILNDAADENTRSIADLNGDGYVNAGDISNLYKNLLSDDK